MPHDRKEREQDIRDRFEFVVFADTEASLFNAALGIVDAIVSGGTYTLQYIQMELGDFGIKVAKAMVNAGVNPVDEPIYSDAMTFHNWEQPFPETKIPLPNKFVPYVAARKRTRDRNVGLQNTAVTKWQGWYLDIDGNKGRVILWKHLASGGRWKLQDLGGGTVTLQVTAGVPWKNWYLDLDGNTGEVILWERLAERRSLAVDGIRGQCGHIAGESRCQMEGLVPGHRRQHW